MDTSSQENATQAGGTNKTEPRERGQAVSNMSARQNARSRPTHHDNVSLTAATTTAPTATTASKVRQNRATVFNLSSRIRLLSKG